jgi:hypothetical protein
MARFAASVQAAPFLPAVVSETDNRRRWRPAVAAWRRTPGESVTKQSRIRKQQTRQAAFDRVNSRAWVPMDDTHTMFVSAGRLRL